jgi:hypothetical protein
MLVARERAPALYSRSNLGRVATAVRVKMSLATRGTYIHREIDCSINEITGVLVLARSTYWKPFLNRTGV